MKLFLLTQNVNVSFDTYASAVVACHTKEEAETIHPQKNYKWDSEREMWEVRKPNGEIFLEKAESYVWAAPHEVTATLLGSAEDNVSQGVVCASK